MASHTPRPLRYTTASSDVFDGLCVANFGTGSLVQVQSGEPTNVDKKDIMPANGYLKPFAGINLLKNRIQEPQIFSTGKKDVNPLI